MNDSDFCLNSVQFKAVKAIANCEMRSMEQILSFLLERGIGLYFFDYEPPSGNSPNVDKLTDDLKLDAINAIKNQPHHSPLEQ